MNLTTTTRTVPQRDVRRSTTQSAVMLNLFPARFSKASVSVAVGLWSTPEEAEQLREKNPGLRTWRDRSDGSRLYAWYRDGRPDCPEGFQPAEVRVTEAPQLVKRLLDDAVERRFAELSFVRKGDGFVNYERRNLLADVPALTSAIAQKPIGIYAKITSRAHYTTAATGKLVLGLVVDVLYTTRLDVPASEWLAAGLKDEVLGSYVVLLPTSPLAARFPHLVGRSIGRVDNIVGESVVLVDPREPELGPIKTDECAPEPTRANLAAYLASRHSHAWAKGELDLRASLGTLVRPKRRQELAVKAVERLMTGKESGLEVFGDLRASFSDMLALGTSEFPTTRLKDAVYSFDPSSDRRTSRRVDSGLKEHGPFDQHQQRSRKFRVLVIGLDENRQEIQSGIAKLENGIPTPQGVFTGMKSMYRLPSIEFLSAFAPKSTASVMTRYAGAAREAINMASPRTGGEPRFDLMIAVINERFRSLPDSENPYFQTKALGLVLDGLPTQAINIENLRKGDYALQYILNTMALACYAKMGGTPHVLSVDRPEEGVTELVFGVGRAKVGESRHGSGRTETIGFATVFRANGQYLYNDCTPYCEEDKYEVALEQTVIRTVTQVAGFEGLVNGAKLRLIFHLPRRPGRHEERAVLNAINKLTRFKVDFALVHVNDDHRLQVFDTSNVAGKGWKGDRPEAAFMAQRGFCTTLGPDERLITFVGTDQYKGHGSPGPLLVRLDSRSTMTDIDYLAQQLFLLSFMNVGSMSPGVGPASIVYAEKVAKLTGHLRGVQQWTIDLIHQKLSRKLWFV